MEPQNRDVNLEVNFEEMSPLERGEYINKCYNDNIDMMLDYPNRVFAKCKSILSEYQKALYTNYCLVESKTRDHVIYFITHLTLEQLAVTGI